MKKNIESLLVILSIILLVLGLFSIIDLNITILITFLISGILSISNGYSSYIKKNKKESILLISTGLFVIIISTFILFF